MISPKLQNHLAAFARNSNLEVYVVIEVSDTEAVVLLVPHGAEGLPVVNPMGSRASAKNFASDDWGRIDKPLLITADESRLPAVPPTLELVDHHGETAA